jgi:hypothetical protein
MSTTPVFSAVVEADDTPTPPDDGAVVDGAVGDAGAFGALGVVARGRRGVGVLAAGGVVVAGGEDVAVEWLPNAAYPTRPNRTARTTTMAVMRPPACPPPRDGGVGAAAGPALGPRSYRVVGSGGPQKGSYGGETGSSTATCSRLGVRPVNRRRRRTPYQQPVNVLSAIGSPRPEAGSVAVRIRTRW